MRYDPQVPQAVSSVKVVAICGSRRPGSYTRAALAVAMEGARKAGGELTKVDLAEWELPLFDDTPATRDHPEVLRLKSTVKAADALLIATPVYHDSLSGVLKNALDLLYHDELMDKVAAMIAVGGGRVGQGQALEHLRAVLREASVWTLPRQVAVPSSKEAFDQGGKPTDPEIEARLGALGQEVVLRARQLRPRRRP